MGSAALLFFGGFAVLLASGEVLVRATLTLAQRLSISPLAAGLTLTAIATSAPEAFISVEAVLNNEPGIALGNVIGSNIANLLLVMGLPVLLFSFSCNAPLVRRNALFASAAVLLLILLGFTSPLRLPQGALLLICAALYLLYILHSARRKNISIKDIEPEEHPSYGKISAPLFFIAAAIGLHFGAQWLLQGAHSLADLLNIPPTVIGLTLIALGTSLPELATSFAAARQKLSELAVGNILGSNIINILGVLGLSAVAGAIPIPSAILTFDIVWLAGITLATLPFFLLRARIPRFIGGLFLCAYGAYLYTLTLWHGVEFVL